MNNYSKVLTFFMENGVQLNKEQLEALKEEFLGEGALKKLVNDRLDKAEDLKKEAQYKRSFGTPKRTEDARELENQASLLRGKHEGIDRSAENVKTFYNIMDKRKGPGHDISPYIIRDLKNQLGQGEKNMSKDREPGEYLRKQEERKRTRLEKEEGL